MPGTQRNYRDFDPYHVELKGKNLVEASAGTGKTYSIALMVTRMIAEGSVGDIRRILVVTFTNSATEELRQRIKRFITSLYEFLTQGIKDPDSVWRISSNIEDTKGASLNLKEALFRIDETPIYTIHSFSKKILTEFAFETGNMFESGIETSIEDLISRFCNTFWRQHIESIEPWILSELIGIRLNRNQIIRAAEKVLKGYRIDNRNTVSLHRAVKEYQALVKERESLEHGIEESFREERSAVTEFLTPKLRQEAEKGLAPLLDTLFKEDGSFNGTYIKKGREEGLNQFKFITDYRRVCRIESTMLPELMEKTAQGLCIKGAYFIKEEVTTLKRNLNIETFDDLINNLYSTLTRCRGRNMEQIRPITEKYSAVFIDEFQDTDYPQYEIFNTIFYEEHKTVFYIGDPKQSIYSWRGADIDLYNSVKEEIQDRVYTMDKNFRTSEPLIHAFNTLFSIIPPGSSTFFHDPRIEYKSVKPGNRERSIVSNSSTDPCGFLEYPLQIHVSETFKNDQITDYTALHIAKLISAGYRDENNNEINPGRIGVIVRTKDQGKAVKNSLRQHNIHAVTIDETSIFETPSAFDTLYLLHAVLMPSEANINRLLITGFFMIPGERLAGFTQGIDPASSGERDNYLEDLYNRLSDTLPDLRELWEREGVYVMIRRFLSDFQIKTRYTASEKTGLDKERRIADIIQLSEILSTAETRQSLTLSGLIEWHSRHIQGKEREEEEYRIRLEEDENAVQIVTIHKSKGLEYDFVFAPFMDLDETRPDEFIRDEQGQPETIRYTDKEGDKERYINSNREENRRLIYVAATRAVYGCSIFSNRRKGVMKKSSLAGVITEIIDKEYKEILVQEAGDPYDQDESGLKPRTSQPKGRKLEFRAPIDRSWSINSYSGLFISPFHSGKHEEVSGGSEYDYWILSHRGGAVFGDMIHDLLEKTDFTDPADWERRVADTGKRYTGVFGREDTGNYKRLIHHTMNAELPSEQSNRFTLSSVKNSLKKPEMEFYFQINTLNSKELTEIIRETAGSDRYTTPRRKHIRGFMRGFIDLVFQHNSKYYILDWKTNNLGPSLSVYAPENKGIERAMTENNYHMQYLIYSVALKRYMELRGTPFSKESFGGVYYLFLRGVREDSGYGVFYRSGSSLVGPVSELDLVFKGKNL